MLSTFCSDVYFTVHSVQCSVLSSSLLAPEVDCNCVPFPDVEVNT